MSRGKKSNNSKKTNFRFRNRKIKFREADYVDKHYIRYGKAVIPIYLESIDDLYMKHDYKKLALSDELCNYIEEIAYIIPLKYPIVLEIHCPEISEREQIRIKKVIKNNYGMEIDDRDYDIRVANRKSISLLALGAFIFISTYAIEPYVMKFVSEFLYIAGWVALWEMCEALMLNNSEKRTERINKLQLYDSEVKFVFDIDDRSARILEDLENLGDTSDSFKNVDIIINNSTVQKQENNNEDNK